MKTLNAAEARKFIDEMQKFRYDDDIAVEVLAYRKGLHDFAGNLTKVSRRFLLNKIKSTTYLFICCAESATTRAPRPMGVIYRVGQVVKHKKFNFHGVIIGWDTKAQVSHHILLFEIYIKLK